ncbi:PAS domain-containing sensor histidine kinase [Nocardioides sp. LS1]|uniref:PAS domain-containing sensor histidine kinase n=1 Tax=Nocardioides sp. LS1 TaxID=1027620 RepID=UPI000F616C1E|nr:PAS domain-containing sensor histidine kinase [Nocardioides sp. LS1]GCD88960.1 hypothetical protein NLS1_09660 [Nocardioides sp. LS1]
MRVAVRGCQLVLLVLVAAFAVTTVPGVRGDGFDTALDGWLQGSAYVACALVAVLRPVRSVVARPLWVLVATALVLRALGFVLYLGYVRTLTPPPYPSVADLAWLAMSVVLLVALAVRARSLAPRVSTTLVLDAVLGALTVAAVSIALLYDTLEHLTRAGTPGDVVATNLAYPAVDVALLIVVTGLLMASQWHPPTSDLVLAVGVVGFAVGDTAFLYQLTAGTYHPGSWLAATSLAATAAIALAGWSGPDREPEPVELPPPGIGVPVVFALVCVAMFLAASLGHLPLGSILLTAAALVVAIARGALTLLEDRAVAGRVLRTTNEELVRFQALVEASGDFIAIAAPTGAVLYVNPAGRRMVGLPPDVDVATTTIEDYLTEEGQQLSARVEVPAVLERGHWEGQSTLRNRNGGPPVPVAISSFLMYRPDGGGPFALATVQRDITERLESERAVQELADQRQDLLGRLVQAQEDERASIAADVHDDSVQALAAVDLRLGLIRRKLVDAAPELLESVDKTLETVQVATGRLRHLLFDLELPALELGVGTALEDAASYVFEDSDIEWEIIGPRDLGLAPAARVTAYRIAKEALINARRHAQARHVTITLEREDTAATVTVEDDGRGVDTSQLVDRPGHLGLSSMYDRATIAGGRLEIDSRPGEGTRVRLWLPLGSGG